MINQTAEQRSVPNDNDRRVFAEAWVAFPHPEVQPMNLLGAIAALAHFGSTEHLRNKIHEILTDPCFLVLSEKVRSQMLGELYALGTQLQCAEDALEKEGFAFDHDARRAKLATTQGNRPKELFTELVEKEFFSSPFKDETKPDKKEIREYISSRLQLFFSDDLTNISPKGSISNALTSFGRKLRA